jgi:hypothetical protein
MARGNPDTPPDPDDLNALIAPRGVRTSAASSSRGPHTFQEYLGHDTLGDMSSLISDKVDPFGGLPVAATGAEFYDAIAIYEDEAGDYYNPEQDSPGGWRSVNYADTAEAGPNGVYMPSESNFVSPKAPAPLSVVPTSTTNAARPRTVAAGYDRRRGVLTCVFRDGTYYNYYEVVPSTWQAFKAIKSKGKYIREVLDFGPRGMADVATLPSQAREILSRLARVGQISGQDRKGVYRQSDQVRRLATQRARRSRKGK